MAQLFSSSFPPVPHSVRAARLGVADCLHAHGFGGVADDAGLLTSELVTNAVVHARTPVHIGVDWDGLRVLVEATDRSDDPPQLQEMSLTQEGGRGLALIAAIAKRWGFEPSNPGKVVWFELEAP